MLIPQLKSFDPIGALLKGRQAQEAFQLADRNRDIRALQQQLADSGGGAFNPIAGQLAALSGNSGKAFEELDKRRQRAFVRDAKTALNFIKIGQSENALSLLQNRLSALNKIDRNADTSDTRIGIQVLQQSIASGDLSQAISIFEQAAGIDIDKLKRKPTAVKTFETLIKIAENPNSTQLQIDSARRELGDLARKSTSAQERIANDPELLNRIAALESRKESAKEEAKLTQRLKFRPLIQSAIKLAESAAKERGEVLTDLGRMQASLPGLRESTSQLKELASIATSTFSGRIFDTAVQETGFGSTKGKTARSKFIGIINNQVLPLLRETFGAQFTAQEGESLKKALADPDATPEEKVAQLEVFIAQKVRDIQAKQLQLGQSLGNTNNQQTNPQDDSDEALKLRLGL